MLTSFRSFTKPLVARGVTGRVCKVHLTLLNDGNDPYSSSIPEDERGRECHDHA